MPKEKPFPTEVALCAAFIESIDKRIWVPYAETAGHDLLLVRKVDGFQIGIQAKLRMGTDVVNQIIESLRYNAGSLGPDCRAVLVPSEKGFREICKFMAIVLLLSY